MPHLTPAKGSMIAKAGFQTEQDVIDKFNNWNTDNQAQEWLKTMGYNISEIVDIHASKLGVNYKSDVNVVIHIEISKKGKKQTEPSVSVEDLQVKLVSNESGFNQIEKKRVEQFKDMWHMPDDIVAILKYYDGEITPAGTFTGDPCKDPRRLFTFEFTNDQQELLRAYLQKYIIMIISDITRGKGRFAAEWILAIDKHRQRDILLSINEAVSIYAGDCKVVFTKKGSIHLGNITLQRKGGDGGRDTANMLQFKVDPLILFTAGT